MEHYRSIGIMSETEAWRCLHQLQLWLASFPPEASSVVIDKIVELASQYQGRAPPPTLQAVYKAIPDGSDRRRASLNAPPPTLDEDDDELEGGVGFDASGWLDKARERIRI